jgi:hypothetical protein
MMKILYIKNANLHDFCETRNKFQKRVSAWLIFELVITDYFSEMKIYLNFKNNTILLINFLLKNIFFANFSLKI